MKGLLEDERGVEPIALKIAAGLILLGIGLGIGVALYYMVGRSVEEMIAFNVVLTPSAASLKRPATGTESRTVTVQIERVVGGYAENVTLSATGMPSGVTVSFSPSSGKPSFASTMTVTVDSTAALGSHTITVRATGADGKQRTATYRLTIQ